MPPESGCPAGQDWNPFPACACVIETSPIVIDTTGNGFHFTSAEDGVMFDISGDGFKIKLGWPAADSGNGWLALPRNGQVTTGKELFGNFTPQPPSLHPNGFLALAVYDTPENGGNGDGVIDGRDSVWENLRIWIDENYDGIAQPNELHTLPSLGIYSISLAYIDVEFADAFGNRFRYRGTVNPNGSPFGDNVNRTIYDVVLDTLKTDAQRASQPSCSLAQSRPEKRQNPFKLLD
jgi:hypothetical protein